MQLWVQPAGASDRRRQAETASSRLLGDGDGNSTTSVGIFLLALAAFAWLAPQSPRNSQIVSRLGLTVSIVESGRLDIDRFAKRTRDKARWNGHYYADKTPGLSFLAIPVVAATTYIADARGGELDADSRRDFRFLAKVTTVAVNAVNFSSRRGDSLPYGSSFGGDAIRSPVCGRIARLCHALLWLVDDIFCPFGFRQPAIGCCRSYRLHVYGESRSIPTAFLARESRPWIHFGLCHGG